MQPILLILAVLSQLGLGAAEPLSKAELEGMAKRALEGVEQMRHQKLSKPLKMGVKSRKEVTTFIQMRLNEEYGPAKVEAEGTLLKLQGLLPPDMNYGGFITRLLSEQVAGFYDHIRKTLYIANWLPVMVQEPVMAHEIFHAIQDQEWGGGALIDSKRYTHDAVLAHAALMEGDATMVMLNYTQRHSGKDLSTSAFAINMVAASLPMQMASPQFPVMALAPDYLKQSLIFPYQQGLLFIAALRQAGQSWDDIRKVYADPPQSTEQVLHPERYLKRDVPSEVKAPKVLPGWSRVWDGTAGEFHWRQVLLARLDQVQAIEAATGWDGDYTAVSSKGTQSVAWTVSVWDSPAEAQAFAAALTTSEQARPAPKPHFVIKHTASAVSFAWSNDAALASQALSQALATAEITKK